MNRNNDTDRFTIQDEKEAAPETVYLADAENLRLEKLSTRVTLVTVLVPCLLVIVLSIAYLDIKNRVASTQNTGTMGVQNLSKDLDSRFSNLSLKQAKLEEQLATATKSLETTAAALQVKVNKAISESKGSVANKADKSDLVALSKKTETALESVKKDLVDLNATFAKFDEELAGQILLMAQGLKKDQERLAEIEKKALQLDGEKLSKESLNLSLGLERLALQELVKEKMREVEKKLAGMNAHIEKLSQQVKAQAKAPSAPPRAATAKPSPDPAAPPAAPAPVPPAPSSGIEEQTIN